MEHTRPRGRSFLEEAPPPPKASSLSNSSSQGDEEDDNEDEGGPVRYDPSLLYDDDWDSPNLLDDEEEDGSSASASGDGSSESSSDKDKDSDNDVTEEDEEDYYSRGRSRSRSVHCNDDPPDGKVKGLSDAELIAQIEQAAKNHEKDLNKPVVARTGALKLREVQALKMVCVVNE